MLNFLIKIRLVKVRSHMERASGKTIPRWYGLAIRERTMLICYFMPIPLNLLVDGVHRLYWRVKWGFYPSHKERTIQEAYQQGRQAKFQDMLEQNNFLKQKIRELQGFNGDRPIGEIDL
jgi:hypothetical protein